MSAQVTQCVPLAHKDTPLQAAAHVMWVIIHQHPALSSVLHVLILALTVFSAATVPSALSAQQGMEALTAPLALLDILEVHAPIAIQAIFLTQDCVDLAH